MRKLIISTIIAALALPIMAVAQKPGGGADQTMYPQSASTSGKHHKKHKSKPSGQQAASSTSSTAGTQQPGH